MKERNEEHVDMKGALKKLWEKRITFVVVWTITIIAVGAGTYLLPKTWKSSMRIVPEYNLQETQAFQFLYEELGIDRHISPTADAITPALYSDVVTNASFLVELSTQMVVDQDGNSRTIASTYKNIKKENILYERMAKDISCKFNKKNDAITISVISQDPVVAKQMVDLVYKQLSDYVSNYRLEKAKRNAACYAQMVNDGQIAATMYEIAQIRVQDHQPPFVVVKEAGVPINKESPHRIAIVFVAWLLITLAMTAWYWRKDIVEWL